MYAGSKRYMALKINTSTFSCTQNQTGGHCRWTRLESYGPYDTFQSTFWLQHAVQTVASELSSRATPHRVHCSNLRACSTVARFFLLRNGCRIIQRSSSCYLCQLISLGEPAVQRRGKRDEMASHCLATRKLSYFTIYHGLHKFYDVFIIDQTVPFLKEIHLLHHFLSFNQLEILREVALLSKNLLWINWKLKTFLKTLLYNICNITPLSVFAASPAEFKKKPCQC